MKIGSPHCCRTGDMMRLNAGHCGRERRRWLPPRDWHGPNVTPPPVAVGLTSPINHYKMPAVRGVGNLCCLPCRRWSGRTLHFLLFPSPKHNRLRPQPTTTSPSTTSLPCQIAELIRQKSKILSRGPEDPAAAAVVWRANLLCFLLN